MAFGGRLSGRFKCHFSCCFGVAEAPKFLKRQSAEMPVVSVELHVCCYLKIKFSTLPFLPLLSLPLSKLLYCTS
jgi:hypothetical protein